MRRNSCTSGNAYTVYLPEKHPSLIGILVDFYSFVLPCPYLHFQVLFRVSNFSIVLWEYYSTAVLFYHVTLHSSSKHFPMSSRLNLPSITSVRIHPVSLTSWIELTSLSCQLFPERLSCHFHLFIQDSTFQIFVIKYFIMNY